MHQGLQDFLDRTRSRPGVFGTLELRPRPHSLGKFTMSLAIDGSKTSTLPAPMDCAARLHELGVRRIIIGPEVESGNLNSLMRTLDSAFDRADLVLHRCPGIEIEMQKPQELVLAPLEPRPPIEAIAITPARVGGITFGSLLEHCHAQVHSASRFDDGKNRFPDLIAEEGRKVAGCIKWLDHLAQGVEVIKAEYKIEARNGSISARQLRQVQDLLGKLNERKTCLDNLLGKAEPPTPPQPKSDPAKTSPPVGDVTPPLDTPEPHPPIEEAGPPAGPAADVTPASISRPENNPFSKWLDADLGRSRYEQLVTICMIYPDRHTFARIFGGDQADSAVQHLGEWLRYLLRDDGKTIDDEYADCPFVGDNIRSFQGVLNEIEKWNDSRFDHAPFRRRS